MLNPSAIYTTSGLRFPVDSEIEVVLREKARYKVGLGWTYRFKSGEQWILLPLDQVDAFAFEKKPEGQTESGDSERSRRILAARGLSHAAKYVDELV
jgi:hypothetical protein